MNALVEMDEVDEVATAPETSKTATKKRSFPTVIVAGLGMLILILTAATGLICYRSRTKNVTPPQVVEQEISPQENDNEDDEAIAKEDK